MSPFPGGPCGHIRSVRTWLASQDRTLIVEMTWLGNLAHTLHLRTTEAIVQERIHHRLFSCHDRVLGKKACDERPKEPAMSEQGGDRAEELGTAEKNRCDLEV
eukprot:1650029-Rhodomonas_salina.2